MIEEQAEQTPYPINTSSEHSSEGSIRFQLTFNDIIEDIEHALRCEEAFTDSNTGSYVWKIAPQGVPLINELGMVRLRTILRSKLNRNAPLSDLEDEEIRNICRDCEQNVLDTLYDNWDYFEIPDVTAATTIIATLGDTIFFNIKKSGEGRFLSHLRSTHHTSEINQLSGTRRYGSPQEKVPIMKRLFGK